MLKLSKIDRAALRVLSTAALPALREALAPFGLTVEPGRSQYSNGATGKLQFDLTVEGVDTARENFERCAQWFELKPEDYGRAFLCNGTAYTISGIDMGRPKFPISGKRASDGKGFKFPADVVCRGLAAADAHRKAMEG